MSLSRCRVGPSYTYTRSLSFITGVSSSSIHFASLCHKNFVGTIKHRRTTGLVWSTLIRRRPISPFGPGQFRNDQSHAYNGSGCIPRLFQRQWADQNAFRSWAVSERSTTRVQRVWLYSAIVPAPNSRSKRLLNIWSWAVSRPRRCPPPLLLSALLAATRAALVARWMCGAFPPVE